MIDGTSLPLGTPLYTHVLRSGQNIHIHTGLLRSHIVLNPAFDTKRKLSPIDKDLAHTFIRDNIVSPLRVTELLKRHLDKFSAEEILLKMEPVMFCAEGDLVDAIPDVFFVDGHHRYVMMAALGFSLIPCYIVPESFWSPYRVIGLPSLTAAELKALPITERNY